MLAKTFWQVQAYTLQRTLRERINRETLSRIAAKTIDRVQQFNAPGKSLSRFRKQCQRATTLAGAALRRRERQSHRALLNPLLGVASRAPTIQIATYIAATPEQVWDALTKPEITEQYWSDARVESDWQVGSTVYYWRQGRITHEHVVLKAEPCRILSYSFYPIAAERLSRELPSRVSFEITRIGRMVRLNLVHDQFDASSSLSHSYREFWPMLLSNLKTLLETGKPLFTLSPSQIVQ